MDTSALIGGVLGGLFGQVMGSSGGGRAGIVIGGSAAALSCFAYNVQSRQSKTAAEARADHERTTGSAPLDPVVVSYALQADAPTARRGQPIKINSLVELVDGSQQPVHEVREELVISSPEGRPFGTGSKPFTATTAGRFENSFEVKLPDRAPTGAYTMKTTLYVNGVAFTTRELSTQLVWNGSTVLLAAVR